MFICSPSLARQKYIPSTNLISTIRVFVCSSYQKGFPPYVVCVCVCIFNKGKCSAMAICCVRKFNIQLNLIIFISKYRRLLVLYIQRIHTCLISVTHTRILIRINAYKIHKTRMVNATICFIGIIIYTRLYVKFIFELL